MKKKILLVVGIIVTLGIISIVFLINKDNQSLNFNAVYDEIAYYYETDSGDYEQGSSNDWSNGSYALNVGKSTCNGDSNPSDILDWDSENKTVLMTSNENNNCTLYFDKAYTAQEFYEKYKNQKVGQGNLLYHDTSLENGAEDNGYRYSGNNPNNFICFGPGSEDYNKGVTGATCPDENLYRMIGYVPVELPDGTKTKLIKVIKSEFVTHDELGIESYKPKEIWSKYKHLKRIKGEIIDGFYWNEQKNNIWESSTLYYALNNNFIKKLGDNWSKKIEQVQWNVTGISGTSNSILEIYKEEMNNLKKVSAKIGLMYVADYGFAAKESAWPSGTSGYDASDIPENQWLFNGLDEWTITPYKFDDDDEEGVWYLDNAGCLDNWTSPNDDYIGVRPVFYLNSDVELVTGENIDGSDSSPYRVN